MNLEYDLTIYITYGPDILPDYHSCSCHECLEYYYWHRIAYV